MKKTLLLLLSLFLLVSCNEDGDGGTWTETPATGNMNRAWVKDNNLVKTVDSLDLSNPSSIKAVMVGKNIKVGEGQNQKPIYKMSYSDCEFSSSGPQMVDDLNGFYDTTLVSGDAEICGQFVPKFTFRYYQFEGKSKEHLSSSFGQLK